MGLWAVVLEETRGLEAVVEGNASLVLRSACCVLICVPPFSSRRRHNPTGLLPRRTMRPYLPGYSVAHVGSDARSRTEPLSCVKRRSEWKRASRASTAGGRVLLSSYHAHNRHPRRHVRSIDVAVLQHASSDCPLSTRRAALRLAPGPVG